MHSVMNGRGPNGYVAAADAYDLGDYLPDHREVKLNGVVYEGWVAKEGGCPRDVIARLARAFRRYIRVIGPLLADPVPEPPDFAEPSERQAYETAVEMDRQERERAADDQDIAYTRYLTDCVLALVPTIPAPEVEITPEHKLEGLLHELGYFSNKSTGIAQETQEVIQVDADPLISTSPQPDSAPSTESVQTNS
jgi:hypothetical protein